MKKMKNLSDEFVISIGLLLTSFFIFQVAVLPTIYRPSQTAGVIFSTKTDYKISKSRIDDNAFNFNYQFSVPKTIKSEALFDIPIEPFDDTKATRELGADFVGEFGNIRDAWGYPVRENVFMSRDDGRGKEKSGGDDRSDEDPDVVGLINCREDTSVSSYFKAYFEDVALNNHVGYDDDTFGQARRDEVCQVLQDIAALINFDAIYNVKPDIIFVADPGNIPPNALAAASSYFEFNPGGLDNGVMYRHIISQDNSTPASGQFDAFVITNFNGVNWDVDSDLNPDTYDFYSVMYHEVLHTLGFRGLLSAVVSSNNNPHWHDTFDSFEYKDDSLANPFFDPANSNLLAPTGAPSPWFIADEVVYRGVKNFVGAVPDGIRPVYSPSSWQQGSSLSHFDMSRSNGEVYVMHPSIGTNTERSIHDHEKEVLCHLGYQVDGVPGCEHPTPWAEDDFIVLPENGDPVCIKPILNDGFFGIGPLVMNSSVNIETEVGDSIVYYSGTDCSGLVTPDAFDARTILFSPGPSLESRTITYDNKSVYDRISAPAKIKIFSLASCTSDTDEYVCNGDFELSFLDGYNTSLDCPGGWNPFAGDVIFWCNFFEEHAIVLSQINSPGLFGSLNGNYIADVNQNFPSAFVTKLKQPLVAGEEYILSFDMEFELPQQMIFGLNQSPSAINTGFWFSSPESTPEQEIEILVPGQEVSTTQAGFGWYRYQQPFVAGDNYESLVLGSPTMKLFVDNVSIKRADAPIDELGHNTIQGVVYYDSNSNGQQDTGETGLPGVEVGLYDASDSTLLQTVASEEGPDLGEYEFTLLPDGDYYIAMINETVYPEITDPGILNVGVIPAHSHVYHLATSGSQLYAGLDFGVWLSSAVTFNLHVKKGLIDSTLSLIDRNITWRVEVTNAGPDDANNIDIVDHIPVPLIYYSHVTTSPNTFNPGTGIWHLPHLEPGEMATLLITTKVPLGTCGVKINKALLDSYDGVDTDPTDNASQAEIKLRACGNVIESVK